jgi:Spy/CpxP family protein refolding chaperone
MKFMKVKKMTLIAALAVGSLLVLNPALLAQDSTNTPPPGAPPAGGPPGGGPGMRGRGPSLEQLTKDLDLTPDQQPKVKAVLDDQMQKMRDLRQDDSLSQDDKRAKGKTIRDEATAKLKEILTPEQFDKWQKISQRNRRPGGPGGSPPGGNPPPAGDKPPQN